MNKKSWISSCLLLSLVWTGTAQAAAGVAVSGATVKLQFQDRVPTVRVNGAEAALDVPARIADGSFYIPLRAAGELLGFPVTWNAERRTAAMVAPRAFLEWDLERGAARINGGSVPLEETALLDEGSLLVKLSWIAPYLEAEYRFYPDPSRVDITRVRPPEEPYRVSGSSEEPQPNSRAMAVFATDKEVYRIGEPVRYFDLSYDPDAEGLPEVEWTGKEEVFFEPGAYTVSLRVSDRHGNWSRPFAKTIVVSEEIFLSEEEYSWHYGDVGSTIPSAAAGRANRLTLAPEAPLVIGRQDRKLIVAGDGEESRLERTGLAFRGSAAGENRFAASYVNTMDRKVEVHIVVRNPGGTEALPVQITREGRIAPTQYHPFVGVQASIDFLSVDTPDRTLEVKPGATEVLEFRLLEPGQGFASVTDIAVGGEAEIGVVVTEAGAEPPTLPGGPAAARDGMEPREELPPADIRIDLDADAENIPGPAVWTTGSAPGTVYSMTLHRPDRGAVALRVKDGLATGALKVNGRMLPLPPGGLTDLDGALLVHRTTGGEAEIDLEWMPAAGSGSAIEWIFYPLEERYGDE